MTRDGWDRLFQEVAALHQRLDVLTDFCPLPDAPFYKPVVPRLLPPAERMLKERWQVAEENRGLLEAIQAAAPVAYWR
ncbi:MAG: hypothetical protein AAFY81_12070, partial [Pseudomonadota bacterium]